MLGGGIHTGDVLVGLHAWSTTDLRDVTEILNRDDLAQLSPLKFYVVRSHQLSGHYAVVTGRIAVRVDSVGFGGATNRGAETTQPATSPTVPKSVRYAAPTEVGPDVPRYVLPSAAEEDTHPARSRVEIPGMAAPPGKPSTKPTPSRPSRRRGAAAAKASLRFEGKTFDEWREAWRTELSTEKRIEAVKALAAFGANGYGHEAAEAVLEIARQYDWQRIPGQNPNKFQNAVLDAFYGGNDTIQVIPANDWFPLVLEGIKSGDTSVQQPARRILRNFNRLRGNAQFATDSLLELTRSEDPSLREDALTALTPLDRRHENPKIVARLQELLASGDARQILDVLEYVASSSAPLPFDASHVLFHRDEQVQLQARRVIRNLRPQQDKDMSEYLLEILADPSRIDDREASVRALGSLGPDAAAAYPELEKIMLDRHQPMPLRVAAIKAMERIERRNSNGYQLLEAVSNEHKDKQGTPEFRAEYKQLEQAIEAESAAIP
jgi:hypothetical protein